MPTSDDLDELLELAVNAAHAAGQELLSRYGQTLAVRTKSSATDPVTEADQASESLLTRLLLDARPDDGIVGEEGASRAGTSGLTWVVDPLDGTVNYLYGLDNFAVSIGLEDVDGPVLGTVHDPVTDRTFTAIRGRGAHLGGRRLQANDPVALDQALLGTGFGYLPERRARQIAVITRVLPQIRDIRRIGSAALDLCAVADGHLDAYYEEGVNRWDVSAGGLIAQEAGAIMSPIHLTDAAQGWLVAGPGLHGPLQTALSLPADPDGVAFVTENSSPPVPDPGFKA